MRGVIVGLISLVAVCFAAPAAMAVPITGSFSGTLSATDLATFTGDIMGTTPGDYHVGDAVSGTFSYDTALMAITSPAGFGYVIHTGPLAFDFTIGGHHFTFSGAPLTSAVALVDPAVIAGGSQYFPATREEVGNFTTGMNVNVVQPGLYSDAHDLLSVHFLNQLATFEFGYSETDPISSAVTQLGHFEVSVLASVSPLAVNPVPVPPALLLFVSALAGLGVMARQRGKRAAA